MSVNVPLLRKYVEWVEEQEHRTDEREWLQLDWITAGQVWLNVTGQAEAYDGIDFCDTAFCFAGKVAVDAGWKPVKVGNEYTARVCRGGEERTVEEVACEALGLPSSDSMWGSGLFAPSNTAADIRRIAEELAGERL